MDSLVNERQRSGWLSESGVLLRGAVSVVRWATVTLSRSPALRYCHSRPLSGCLQSECPSRAAGNCMLAGGVDLQVMRP